MVCDDAFIGSLKFLIYLAQSCLVILYSVPFCFYLLLSDHFLLLTQIVSLTFVRLPWCLLFVCLFVCLFIIQLKNFSLIWRRHHYQWRAANFDLCSAHMAIKQWGFFSVPHLLWNIMTIFKYLWHSLMLLSI